MIFDFAFVGVERRRFPGVGDGGAEMTKFAG